MYDNNCSRHRDFNYPRSQPSRRPPIIAETGTSVSRIAVLYKQGNSAEEIARLMTHLSSAQVYAALTYYHANREEIDRDLAEEQEAYEQLADLHYKNLKTHP